MADTFYLGTGRRKTAVARVRLKKGEGRIVVNDRPIEDYFPVALMRKIIGQPFQVAAQFTIADDPQFRGRRAP